MKIQNAIKAAFGALLIGAAAQASATAVPVSATGLPAAGTLLTGNYTGSFDLSFLPSQYTINGIGFSFAFSDDSNDPYATVTSTPVKTSSSVVSGTGNNLTITITKTTTTDVTKTGQQESVQLSFGSVFFNGATVAGLPVDTTDKQTGQPVPGASIYTKSSGTVVCTAQEAAAKNSSCKLTATATIDNTVTNTRTIDYTGNIALADSLLSYQSLLASLQNTKSLGFNLGVTGDLYLTGASLNIDYTDTTPAPSQSVPEPASLALFGIALMGVAGVRRARRG